MGTAYLSLGSNVEPERHLRAAVAALRARFGEVLLSPVYRTRSVGFDGTDFLNAAAVIDSDLDPFALNDWLHALEDAHGRDRSGPRWAMGRPTSGLKSCSWWAATAPSRRRRAARA